MEFKIPNKTPKSPKARYYSKQNLKFFKKVWNMLNFPENM